MDKSNVGIPKSTISIMASADASSHLIAPGEHPAIAAGAAVIEQKAECARRINAVADERTQGNMLAAANAGLLSKSEIAAHTAFLGWVRAMLNARRVLAVQDDPTNDAYWPPVPTDVAALAQEY